MGDMRLAVPAVAAVSVAATTIAAALAPPLQSTYGIPALYVAVATAGPLIAVFAGILVLIRFLQRPQASELALLCSLLALALSQLAFAAVPVGSQRVSQVLLVWAAFAGRAVGAALFALAAFAPRRRLDRPGLALAAGATAVVATLLLIAVLVVSFAPGLPGMAVAATGSRLLVRADLHADAVLLGLGAAVAMTYVVAAAGFVRRTPAAARFRDELAGWLAIAAVLAAAAQVNWSLHPALSARVVSLGEVFRLCSFAVIFVGSAFQICSYWQGPPGTAVLDERRRIARDLHDGLAQELAYLRRHLTALDGGADSETNACLRRAAERAEHEARLIINGLPRPRREFVNVTIARAAGEVAARDHIELVLDIPPGIRLPAARAEALTRIACEAVGNAARHSGAGRVTLTVRRLGPRVRLLISDSGAGFDPAAHADGYGFASMNERAGLVGGDLRISSAPGGGTEVEATL
jgi:signal transduction histidine kinase